MKKLLFILLSVVALFSSCSKDDDEILVIKGSDVYGLWTTTEVESNGKWIDVKNPGYKDLRAYARFYKDGTNWGVGALGIVYGTGSVACNIRATFVDGEEYIKYKVDSLE